MASVPEYAVWEIERRAGEVLRRAYPEGAPEAAVDIEWVVETSEGLEIVPVPELRRRWLIDGMLCCYRSGGYCVIVDGSLLDRRPTRYRFTLAEELGHFILHANCLPKVRSVEEGVRAYHQLDNWRRADRNARRFAAAVLMPMATFIPAVERVYRAVVRTTGFEDPEAIRRYMISFAAREFEVSAEAVGYRFRENRGYLDRRTADAIERRLEWLP